jgi:hypothetical protein
MADSEGEENTMRTNQPDMVRQSLEATAHPDVYARRKMATRRATEVVIDLNAPVTPETAEALVGAIGEAISIDSWGIARVRGAEGDHDDPDHCTCPATPRDADGNCDLIERDDCPVHGKAHESVLRRPDPRSSARARPGAVAEALGDEEPIFPLPQMDFSQRPQGLPDSADTRLHGSATTREDEDAAQYFGPSMADLGRRREGWRGRLAHVEMLLSAGRLRVGNVIPAEIDQALAELRALIDEA